MENFFADETFYAEVEDLINDRELEKEDVEALPDDYEIKIEETTEEPIFQLKMDWICNAIVERTDSFEDRFPEDNDSIFRQIEDAIKSSVDLGKLNSKLPKLYYPNGKFSKLTKQDLLNACD